MDLGLEGRVCVVTGASRGIGRATAELLAAEGARLLLIGRDEEALAAVAAQTGAETLAVDLAMASAGERVAARCREQLGEAAVLVNNAGTSTVRGLEELSDAEWQAQWELHVMAPMRLMRTLVPGMARAGWGRVVNVSSSSGKRPGQRNVAYSVSKAAVLSLSRAYADAYAAQGVLVNAVAPGPVGTELWLGAGGLGAQAAAADGSTIEAAVAKVAAGVPVRRLGTAEEIAAAIVFLCSERASFVSGAAWSVDGGAVPVII